MPTIALALLLFASKGISTFGETTLVLKTYLNNCSSWSVVLKEFWEAINTLFVFAKEFIFLLNSLARAPRSDKVDLQKWNSLLYFLKYTLFLELVHDNNFFLKLSYEFVCHLLQVHQKQVHNTLSKKE